MPPPELLVTFLLATSVFAYMPGPSTLYSAAQTIARGKRAGWCAALGIHLGGYVHVIAAAAGLTLLFEAVPFLYLAVKLLGAGYLILLGIGMLLARRDKQEADCHNRPKDGKRAFWQSVSVEVLNPKTAVFYIAFLPQFADPQAAFAIWVQLLILGTLVNIMLSSADVLCVLMADRVMRFFKASAGAQTMARRISGCILVLLGLNLAFDRQ